MAEGIIFHFHFSALKLVQRVTRKGKEKDYHLLLSDFSISLSLSLSLFFPSLPALTTIPYQIGIRADDPWPASEPCSTVHSGLTSTPYHHASD